MIDEVRIKRECEIGSNHYLLKLRKKNQNMNKEPQKENYSQASAYINFNREHLEIYTIRD